MSTYDRLTQTTRRHHDEIEEPKDFQASRVARGPRPGTTHFLDAPPTRVGVVSKTARVRQGAERDLHDLAFGMKSAARRSFQVGARLLGRDEEPADAHRLRAASGPLAAQERLMSSRLERGVEPPIAVAAAAGAPAFAVDGDLHAAVRRFYKEAQPRGGDHLAFSRVHKRDTLCLSRHESRIAIGGRSRLLRTHNSIVNAPSQAASSSGKEDITPSPWCRIARSSKLRRQ